MMPHLEAIGRKMGAPMWEVYLNSPDQVPEEQLLTDVFTMLE